jgi:hypothetical protein
MKREYVPDLSGLFMTVGVVLALAWFWFIRR